MPEFKTGFNNVITSTMDWTLKGALSPVQSVVEVIGAGIGRGMEAGKLDAQTEHRKDWNGIFWTYDSEGVLTEHKAGSITSLIKDKKVFADTLCGHWSTNELLYADQMFPRSFETYPTAPTATQQTPVNQPEIPVGHLLELGDMMKNLEKTATEMAEKQNASMADAIATAIAKAMSAQTPAPTAIVPTQPTPAPTEVKVEEVKVEVPSAPTPTVPTVPTDETATRISNLEERLLRLLDAQEGFSKTLDTLVESLGGASSSSEKKEEKKEEVKVK